VRDRLALRVGQPPGDFSTSRELRVEGEDQGRDADRESAFDAA
jgi:hypothetical protein